MLIFRNFACQKNIIRKQPKNIRNKVKTQTTTLEEIFAACIVYIMCVTGKGMVIYRYKEPVEREQLAREGRGRETEGGGEGGKGRSREEP